MLLVGTLTDAGRLGRRPRRRSRDLRVALDEELGEGTALVGGVTATDIDSNATSIRDRTLIIPVVLLVILVILMLLLRAIVAPIILILSVILSFGAALGRQRDRLQHGVRLRRAPIPRCRCTASCSSSRSGWTTTSS